MPRGPTRVARALWSRRVWLYLPAALVLLVVVLLVALSDPGRPAPPSYPFF